MSEYKLIDAEQLDNDLKSVADSIRAKANTSALMVFPSDFISAVDSIEKSSGSNTDDATAYASDIRLNKTAYVRGQKVTGTMPDNGSVSATISDITAVYPKVVIPEGYTSGGTITLTDEIRSRLEAWLYENTDIEKGVPISIAAMLSFLEGVSIGSGDVTEKPYVDTSKITDYSRFFYGGSRLEILDKIDTSDCENFSQMFQGCTTLETIPILEVNHTASFSQMFYGCTSLKMVPFLDTSKTTGVTNMFNGCTALESVKITTLISNLVTSNTFANCTALKNLEIGEGFSANLYLQYSENLTQESLHGMIENLADLTGLSSKTFRVGTTNLAKIDAEHMAMLDAKNWTYS